MCKCTPTIRTPFCGKMGCEWPDTKKEIEKETIESRVEFIFDRLSKIEKERADITMLQLEVAFLKDEVRMLTEIVYKIKDLL